MNRDFPLLTSPITIGNVQFKNRMLSAPTAGTDMRDDHIIGPGSIAYYNNRARGGIASVTISEVAVHPETDASPIFRLNDETIGSLRSFALTANAIARHGAVPNIELTHCGQFARAYMRTKYPGQKFYGPVYGTRPDGEPINALTKKQLSDITQAFAKTAALAKQAGFKMVLIHAGHGWLLNQFMSPYLNTRTDEYGGGFTNRMRLTLEVLEAVRGAVGPGFPIEIRISGSEFMENGYDLDYGIKIAKAVEDLVDLLHVSAGSWKFGFGITHPSMFEEHGRNVYLAAEIKKHVKVPVVTLGGLNDPEQMEEILASGKADVIEMARALVADPMLPRKVIENRPEDIVYCLRCLTCLSQRYVNQTRKCAVNPTFGYEFDGTEVTPVLHPKKVLIAGGGPAGLEAALTAAKRGHTVVLCEKEAEVGGILISEQAIPFKYEMYKLAGTLKKLAEDAGAEIRLETEVTPELVLAEAPDVLIVAAGSVPFVPPIPGINGDNVVNVTDYYKKKDEIGEHIAIMGGGMAGCELAVHLNREGKKVELVEMQAELAPDAPLRHRPLLLDELDKGVVVHTETTGLEITVDGLSVRRKNGRKHVIKADTIIVAAGQRARSDVAAALADAAPYVLTIGDCNAPATITKAVSEGYHAALDI